MLNESFTERSRWPLHEEEGEPSESGPEMLAAGWYHQEDGTAALPIEGEGWVATTRVNDVGTADETTWEPQAGSTTTRTLLYIPSGNESVSSISVHMNYESQGGIGNVLTATVDTITPSGWDSAVGSGVFTPTWQTVVASGDALALTTTNALIIHCEANTGALLIGDVRLS